MTSEAGSGGGGRDINESVWKQLQYLWELLWKRKYHLLTIQEGISSFVGGDILPFIVSELADLLIYEIFRSPNGEVLSLTGVLHNGEEFPVLLPTDSTETDDLYECCLKRNIYWK